MLSSSNAFHGSEYMMDILVAVFLDKKVPALCTDILVGTKD